jgi:hypothetical protein
MTEPEIPQPFVEHRLRDVLEGQVLRLADASFAVAAKHRRHRLVHLELEADDGTRATLIGIPGARFRRREENTDDEPPASPKTSRQRPQDTDLSPRRPDTKDPQVLQPSKVESETLRKHRSVAR